MNSFMLSAAKWGALVGVGSYLILTVGLTLLNAALFGNGPADLNHPGVLSLVCLGLFGIFFAFSAAGYFTGRETLKAGLGAVSAVIALILYYLLGLIYTPGRGTASAATAPATSTAGAHPLPAVFQALATIVAALIVLGCAALMGWLGARPAVQQARKRLGTSAAATSPATSPDAAKTAPTSATPTADHDETIAG